MRLRFGQNRVGWGRKKREQPKGRQRWRSKGKVGGEWMAGGHLSGYASKRPYEKWPKRDTPN